MPNAPSGLSELFYAPRGWTWGSLKIGESKPIRYGVASPPTTPRGSVLILSDRSEPAEVWFETANDLMAKGYAVWVLEASSVEALDPGKGVLSSMIRDIVRPRAGQALVLVGDGLGATAAMRALTEGGVPGVSAVMLQRPELKIAGINAPISADQAETVAEWAEKLHLGALVLPGDGQLGMPGEAARSPDPKRTALAAAWRRSDPALRLKGATWGWLWAYDSAAHRARAPTLLARIKTPVIMAAPDDTLAAVCAEISTCLPRSDFGAAPHLETDVARNAWMTELTRQLERYRTARP